MIKVSLIYKVSEVISPVPGRVGGSARGRVLGHLGVGCPEQASGFRIA